MFDNKQKYIKLEDNSIIIFPMIIQHSAFKELKPITAGFCYIYEEEVCCFGESFSLGIKADKNDSEIATRQIFGFDAMCKLHAKNNK
jgi:hypothetical protein